MNITGIILAAGSGVRLGGKVKALLKIDDQRKSLRGKKTFIETISSNLKKSGVKNIVIVLGYKAEIIKKYLKNKKISANIVINRNYNSQQLTSLKLAIRNLPENCDGIIFTPVDHPLVKL